MTQPIPKPIPPEEVVKLARGVVEADRFPYLASIDADLVMRAFGAGEWEYLDRELATALGLVMDLQAALERARSSRPR